MAAWAAVTADLPRATEKPKINGASGVPIRGREVEYATELWLEGPSAFWLHPEGPLSDKTPEEWKAEQEAKRPKPSPVQNGDRLAMEMQLASLARMQAFQSAANMANQNPYMNQLNDNYAQNLFGFRLRP